MSEWVSDTPDVLQWVLSHIEKRESPLPILVLQVNKLYKLRLLENPRNIEGTEGYMVKVMNEANRREYLLFLQRILASKFREVGAKEGDTLVVVNKGKNMQTGYDYAVAPWDEAIDEHLRRGFGIVEALGSSEKRQS